VWQPALAVPDEVQRFAPRVLGTVTAAGPLAGNHGVQDRVRLHRRTDRGLSNYRVVDDPLLRVDLGVADWRPGTTTSGAIA